MLGMSFPSWRVGAALTVALLVAGCASSTGGGATAALQPYRMEVVQGNVVTREMLEQLRPGLTRDQVRGLFGSPLLTDIFHADRWDYVFTIRRQGAAPQQRRVTVYFANDRVQRHEAGELPSEREFVASIDAARVKARSAPLELNEAQLRALPLPVGRPAAAVASAGPASAPQRVYPPLEPDARP
jgi:outer membrane protein assembly factor BamE